jgi:hypothetical protein
LAGAAGVGAGVATVAGGATPHPAVAAHTARLHAARTSRREVMVPATLPC